MSVERRTLNASRLSPTHVRTRVRPEPRRPLVVDPRCRPRGSRRGHSVARSRRTSAQTAIFGIRRPRAVVVSVDSKYERKMAMVLGPLDLIDVLVTDQATPEPLRAAFATACSEV